MLGNNVLPTRLYKFQPFTTLSLSNLKSRAIWFSRPTSFNDPFDCSTSTWTQPIGETLSAIVEKYAERIPDRERSRYFDEDEQPTQEFIDSINRGLEAAFLERQQVILNERGVSCFAELNENLLMWSHYADGHRGFSLEFDTSFEPFASKIHQVQYSRDVPNIDPGEALLNPGHEIFYPLIFTKSFEWRYECEWRLLHMEPDKLYSYDPRSLTGIYLGCSVSDANSELVCTALRDSPTKIYRMRRSDDRFEISAEDLSTNLSPTNERDSPLPNASGAAEYNMPNDKTDLKNIELVKQLSILRNHIDVHRIIGLNADDVREAEISSAFADYLRAAALNGLTMHICKIYERSGRNDLNSIPGIIDSLPSRKPTEAERKALAEFGAKYLNTATPENVKTFLLGTFGLLSGLASESLSKLKQYRDTIGAHSDHNAKQDALPSHDEFERLYDFALDFYNVVSKAILKIGPAKPPRTAGDGLVRTLKSLGVRSPMFDFPPEK
jgi:hypothetical protein